MLVFSRWIEHALDMAAQRFHHADVREHRRAAEIDDEYERLDRGLPFRQRGFFLRKASNVGRRFAQCPQLAAIGEGDRILEFARPARVANGASPSCRIRCACRLAAATYSNSFFGFPGFLDFLVFHFGQERAHSL
jgi:hypothetical protein